MTSAGPVKVTKADGSVEVRPAYSPGELGEVLRKGQWRGKGLSEESRRRGGKRAAESKRRQKEKR